MMVGKYQIEVYDKRVAYHLEVKRNITIIQGNSATGKTELVRMISDYNRGGRSSGVTIICQKECIALNVLDWKSYLLAAHDKIFLIDENNEFVRTKEFAEIVNSSDNYFVLVCRDSLPQLSYSIDEVYGMRENRESQKYIGLKKTYNELYKIYNLEQSDLIRPDVIVTEDSNAGFECFHALFSGECVSAGGKSNVQALACDFSKDGKTVLAIVDGAAFGADIQQFMRKCRNLSEKCVLYAPESFEFLLLSSGIVQAEKDRIENTYDYADSAIFASWERYYTNYLMEITEGTVYQYTKRHLNRAYLSDGNQRKISRQIPKLIVLDKRKGNG